MAFVSLAPRASAAPAATETLTGQLVDLAYYSLNKNAVGAAHLYGVVGAQATAREGFPVGLLTSEGKVVRDPRRACGEPERQADPALRAHGVDHRRRRRDGRHQDDHSRRSESGDQCEIRRTTANHSAAAI